MHRNVPVKAEPYAAQNRLRRIWRKIVRVMACIVVFCTTYAMILPAITKENKLLCGLPEHTHTQHCYAEGTVQTLICTESGGHVHTDDCYEIIPEQPAHSHGDGCYTTQRGALICTMQEQAGHTHDESCYGQVLTCPVPENHIHTERCWKETTACSESVSSGHIHGPGCMKPVRTLVCEIPEGHTHAEGCFARQCICSIPEAPGHSHEDGCYAQERVLRCGLAELETAIPAQRKLICTDTSEHIHNEDCFRRELTCGFQAHTHTLSCRSDPRADLENPAVWEKSMAAAELTGEWAHDVVTIARTQLGYRESSRNYKVLSDGISMRGYTRYGAWYGDPYGDWCAMFASFCLKYADVQMPLESNVDQWIAKLSAPEVGLYRSQGSHVPEPGQLIFFDWDGDGSCNHVGIVDSITCNEGDDVPTIRTIEGNAANQVRSKTYSLGNSTILGYGVLPEQIVYVCGMEEHTHGDSCTDENGAMICTQQEHTHTENCIGLTVAEQSRVDAVVTQIDGLPSAAEIEAQTEAFETADDAEGEEAYIAEATERILEAYYAYSSLDTRLQGYVTNAEKLMELEYIWSAVPLADNTRESIPSAPVTVLKDQANGGRVAHTSDFISLNLYNYDYGVNENWRSNHYYPGFQWPGGAYTNNSNGWQIAASETSLNIGISNWRVNRQKIDSINFGDSLVANHQYADTVDAFDNNPNGKHGKSPNATKVGQLYTSTAAQSVGKINWLWWNADVDDSVTNRPAGLSTTGKAIRFKLHNGVPYTIDDISLGYLFPYTSAAGTTANGVTKQNSQSIDGLFQINPVSGAYYFDSRESHAQYSNNKFTLYDQVITPNMLLYPFGNFLPFNTITANATQVGAMNKQITLPTGDEGGMKLYVNYTINNLNDMLAGKTFSDYNYSTRLQLKTMLEEYKESWYNTGRWATLTSSEAIRDFFTGAEGPGVDPGFTQAQLDKLYNIDWDVATDFFFGMDMSMNLLMPKDGLTGNDNGNNNMPWTTLADGTKKRTGSPDGIPDYPMVFNFAGDDDVWVFVDGLLFLDLTGIHRHVGGTIDFEAGMVYYFDLSPKTGDITSDPTAANSYYAETFEDIIRRSFTASEPDQMNALLSTLRPVLNPDGSQRYYNDQPMKTFKDYSTHSFKFFYMERGSGSSVCRMNFNFPLLRENSISVVKELTSTTGVEMVGDPEFSFQIMKANADGSRTQTPFYGAGEMYTIYDSATNEVIGNGTTAEYGVFTIKAGQRAEFAGIQESQGKYYIREILDNKFYDQYDSIMVDGKVITQIDNIWDQYKGPVSPVKDISNGSTVFIFNNQVDASKLSYLTITKIVDGVNAEIAKTLEFDMMVELNGTLKSTEGWTPIPVGTKYTLYDTAAFIASNGTNKIKIADRPDRVVTTEGIVTVPGGATAEIDYMIPGTTYRAYETSGSAEGYKVGYGEFWGEEWITAYDDRVEGTIPVYNESNIKTAHVCMTVKNTLNSTRVTFSVYKQIPNGSLGSADVGFTATSVQVMYGNNYFTPGAGQDGFETSDRVVPEMIGHTINQSVTITSVEQTQVQFNLYFDATQIIGNKPWKFVYEITEDDPGTGEYTHDPTKYYAVFYLYRSGGNVVLHENKVYLTKNTPYPQGTVISSQNAEFTNYLLGDLALEKIVDGPDAKKEDDRFNFKVQIGTDGTTALKNWPVTIVKNGATVGTQNTDTYGFISLTEVKHGDRIELKGIPLGCVWRITETNSEGYEVSWTKTDGSGSSNVAEGGIPAGGMEVVFTNKSAYVYELPETGNLGGTTLYTVAGLVLMLSMAYLMYRTKARGKGEFQSP